MTAQPPSPAAPTPGPTPGPWEWDAGDIGQDYSQPYCDVFVNGGNLIIAQVNDRFSREIGHANARLIANAPETVAERDRLVVVNEGLVKALEKITQIQRNKCESASAEILFMLLDNKVGIALAALAEARRPPVGQSPEGAGG